MSSISKTHLQPYELTEILLRGGWRKKGKDGERLERKREERNALARQASFLFFIFLMNDIIAGSVGMLSLGAAYILFDLVINVKYYIT